MPATPLLGLELPDNGTLAGTWGNTVNDAITSLIDTAIAGTTQLTLDADVTLTIFEGALNEARAAVLLCTGARSTTRLILAPNRSKVYIVINTTTQPVRLAGVTGPTTGVTIVSGEEAIVAWNGSDFVRIANRDGPGVFTTISGDGSGITAVTTAPQFDNDTSPASTAFVQRALGNLAGRATYTTSTSIAAADVGKWIFIPSGTGSISLSLPATVLPNGSRYYVYNNTTASNVTITTTGAITSGTVGALGSVVVGPGQTFDITTDGVNNWVVSQGDLSRQAAFARSLTANGYQVLPGGLMIQWGSYTHGTTDGATTSVTFVPSFNNVWSVTATDNSSVVIAAVSSITTGGFTGSNHNREPAGSIATGPTRWIAIGN
jgi:hypothetical protein